MAYFSYAGSKSSFTAFVRSSGMTFHLNEFISYGQRLCLKLCCFESATPFPFTSHCVVMLELLGIYRFVDTLWLGTSVVPCPRSNACSRNVSGDVDGCGGGGGVGIGAVALGAGREELSALSTALACPDRQGARMRYLHPGCQHIEVQHDPLHTSVYAPTNVVAAPILPYRQSKPPLLP